MRLLAILLAGGVGSALALSDYVKYNVRTNLGSHRVLEIQKNQMTDVLHQIFEEHGVDKLGHSEGTMHVKLSQEAVDILLLEGVEFEDTTESFIATMERNLQREDYVCEDGPVLCATTTPEVFYSQYQMLDTLYERYDRMHLAYPDITEITVLGLTYEGREQKLFWIGDQTKPLVYYFCNIHAREWITPMFCAYMAETLIDKNNDLSKRLLETYSFVITPSANPDGYAYTHSDDNLWRKTREPNEGSTCVGTDPNRNYAQGWGGEGASSNPCSETYFGTAPFDQNETLNIKNFVDEHQDRIIHINDVHAYGEYWMSPYASTYDLPPQEDWIKMQQVNQAVFDKIFETSGLSFSIGSVANTIYIASGGAVDQFYTTNGILHSYTYEARDGGRSGAAGFQPNPSNIMPSNIELFAGLVAALETIENLELLDVENCADREISNVLVDGLETECADLEQFCEEYSQVKARCPLTCEFCQSRVVSYDAESGVFTIETEGGSESNDNNLTPGAIFGVVLIAAAAAVLGAYGLFAKRASKREQSVEVALEVNPEL